MIVLELYNLEIHQKKAKPDCHRLKTMVKEVSSRIYERGILKPETGNFKTSAVVKNQRVKQREQSLPGCWQWQPVGSVRKETVAVSGTTQISVRNLRHRPLLFKAKSPRGKLTRMPCKDHLKGTSANPSCEKWHFPESLFYKSAEGWKFGEKCAFAHRQVEEQPSNRSKRSGDNSAVAMLTETKNLGCVFQDVERPRSSSILQTSSTTPKPIRCVQFTTAVLRNAKIRDQNPSLNNIC